MDPEYGLPALKAKAPEAGVLLAYEKTGYDANLKGRLPDVLDHWSVRRLVEAGASAIKILIYYDPFDDKDIVERKNAWLERIGAECAGVDAVLPRAARVRRRHGREEPGVREAQARVREGVHERALGPTLWRRRPQGRGPGEHGVCAGLEGEQDRRGRVHEGRGAAPLAEAAKATAKPFIYLSAGVNDDVFRESLEYAAEAAANFNGVLCGRATWKDGIPVYAKEGPAAFERWLEDRGVKNIEMLNEVLRRTAKPWWDVYGGKQALGL